MVIVNGISSLERVYIKLFSPLMKVEKEHIFDSESFEVYASTYATAWFVIYDKNGNTICSSNGKGLNCEL